MALFQDEAPVRLQVIVQHRMLTEKQHQGLDRIVKKDPDAIVTGWSDFEHGPVVRMSSGTVKIVRTTGYTTQLR